MRYGLLKLMNVTRALVLVCCQSLWASLRIVTDSIAGVEKR